MNTARPIITWCVPVIENKQIVNRRNLGAQLLLVNQDRVSIQGLEPIVKLQVSAKRKHFNKFATSKYAAQGKC